MEQAITDKAPKPAGLVPKNLQAFLLVGLALLMVLIMAITGHKRPVSPVAQTASPFPSILPLNTDKVTDFQKSIEQTQLESAPQAEEALLQKQKQLAAQGMGSAQPFPPNPLWKPGHLCESQRRVPARCLRRRDSPACGRTAFG